MSDPEYLATLFEQFDAEYDRIAATEPGSDEQGSAIDGAADALFKLREKVKAGYPGKKAYYLAASTDAKAVKVEGIVALQGKRAHELIRKQHWMHLDDKVVLEVLDDDQRRRYDAVAGQDVAQTFREAREYLWIATGLGKE